MLRRMRRALLQRRVTQGARLRPRQFVQMHSESNHMEESLSRHSTGPGDTHSSDSNLNVAPASDVIPFAPLRFPRSMSLRCIIRHVTRAARASGGNRIFRGESALTQSSPKTARRQTM